MTLRAIRGAGIIGVCAGVFLLLPAGEMYAAVLIEQRDVSQVMVASDPQSTPEGLLNVQTCYPYTAQEDGTVSSVSFYQKVSTDKFPFVTIKHITQAQASPDKEQNFFSWQYAPNNYVEGIADGTGNMELYTLAGNNLHNFYGGSQEIVLTTGDEVEVCLGAYSKPNWFPKSYGASDTLGDGTTAYIKIESAEAGCTENCYSNVLFLPGFVGSRLYTFSGDRKLWEPNGGDDVRDLAMNADGTTKLAIYVGDVIDSIKVNGISLGTIYGNLLEWMSELKNSGMVADARAFPYDWRYDVFDVVDDGVLKEDGEREYLLEVIESLATSSKTGKVTLIGHSNGGLLAKAAMLRLEEAGKESLVDRVIFIGTPQAGTPQGMLGLLHGHDILSPIVALNGTTRASASTMPGAYSLLPSRAYFNTSPESIARFASGAVSDDYRDVFGETIDSFNEYVSLLLNEPFTRNTPETYDEETPLPLSETLWAQAEETHELLDSWAPPAGVFVHEIAGWGNRTTIGAKYITEKSYECSNGFFSCGFYDSIDFEPKTVLGGDDTVLATSALFQDSGVYFDLEALRRLPVDPENRKHESLTESEHVHTYLNHLLGISSEYNTNLFVGEVDTNTEEHIVISTHSPVLISVKSTSGKESGVFRIPNSDLFYTKTDIPSSSVHFGGEGKYVYIPKDAEYDIDVEGIGSGTFTVRVAGEDGEVQKEFTNMPVNEETKATFTVLDGEASELLLDTDGNGSLDITVGETLTRRDALKLCRAELKGVRSPLIRSYLLAVLIQMERPQIAETKYGALLTAFKHYLESKLRTIPQGQREAIATCVTALENSKK